MAERADERAAIEHLLPAAALGALTPEEAARVAAFVAHDPVLRAELARLRAQVDAMALAPEPVTPSPDLRDRIMREIARTPQDAPIVPLRRADAPARRDRSWSWRDLGLVASLAGAVYLGSSVWALQQQLAQQSAQLAQQEQIVRAATSGRIVVVAGTSAAPQVRGALAESDAGTVVRLENLPDPGPAQLFEVWLIPAGGAPVGAGLSAPGRGGSQTVRIDRPLQGMAQVAITREPAGGSPAPTTPILAAGQL